MRAPAVAAVAPAHEPAGQEDHAQDNHDEQQDARARAQGAVVPLAAGQRARHRRRHPPDPRVGHHHAGRRRGEGDALLQRWIPPPPGPVLRGRSSPAGAALLLLLSEHARAAEHLARAPLHHQPDEKQRGRHRGEARLEVRRDGGRQVLPHHLHPLHRHLIGGGPPVGAAYRDQLEMSSDPTHGFYISYEYH